MSPKEFKNYDCRKFQISLLPHRIQVVLAYTYAKKALPVFANEYPSDHRPQQALTATLNWINQPTQENAKLAQNATSAAVDASDDACAYSYAVADAARCAFYAADVIYTSSSVSYATVNACSAGISWEWVHKTYLDAKGPNFPFQNTWKTTDTITLAKTIWQDQDLSLMKILADALQDAGMQDETLLKHLQEDECEISDWALSNLLGFYS